MKNNKTKPQPGITRREFIGAAAAATASTITILVYAVGPHGHEASWRP